jgi:hypothetical protein
LKTEVGENGGINSGGHILRMNKERFPKKVLNMKVRGICPRGEKEEIGEEELGKDGGGWIVHMLLVA